MGQSSAGNAPLLELLFEEPGVGRCLVAPDGTILRVNAAWLRATAGELVRAPQAGEADAKAGEPAPAAAREAAQAMCRLGRPEGRVSLPGHLRRPGHPGVAWDGEVDPVPMDGGTGWLLRLREAPGTAPQGSAGAGATLRETRAKLAAALASMTDAVFISDEQGNILEFNEAFASYHRFPSKAECARTFAEFPGLFDVFLPDGSPAPTAQWAVPRALRGETAVNAEYAVRRRDTGECWTGSYNFAPIREAGRIVGAVVVARDITAARRAEQALRESEQRFRLVLRNAPVSVAAQDRELRFVWAYNQRTARPEEVIGRTDADFFSPEQGAHLRELKRRVIDEGVEVREALWLDRPGGRHYLEVYLEPLRDEAGRVVGVGSATVDLTQAKLAEEALREREERLAVTLRSIGDAVIATDGGGRVTLLNPEASRLTGWAPEEAAGRPVGELFRIVDEEARQAMESPVDRALREGVVVGLANHAALVARDGTARPIADTAAPIRDGEGRITGAVLVFRDQTAERTAARDLRHRELRFRAMFDQAAVGVAEVETATGRFLRVNQRFCEMLGYPLEELMGLSWRALTHPDDLDEDEDGVRRMLESGEPHRREKRYLRKDGSTLWARVNVNRVALPGEPPTSQVAVVEDVTEHRALEERLRQAQQLESVGRLAGGVAHDFNNLLTVILSCAGTLERALPRELSDLVDDAHEIREAGRRASDLTRQLLAFARKQLIAPVPLDLGEVLQGSERMLRRILGEDIDLQVRREPDLWTIHADPGQLEQVIVNLAVNARDAMPRGGTLTLETGKGRTSPEVAAQHPDRPAGDWVRLFVRDTGAGMAPEVRAHLFEPFFTTKGPGKGTGLGLATVYGIVQQAGGHVHVESEPGRGTTFELCFPRFDGPPVPRAAPAAPAVTTGSERILVVEDDPQVRGVVVRALQQAGYDVLNAPAPQAALELSEEELRRVRLLLTDVIMPGQDGHELASAFCRRFPAVRVLYLSGYTQDIIADHGVLGPGIELLQKPFTGPQLLARVRAVLDAAGQVRPDGR